MPGCGKTLLSSIISSFDRVELLSYSFEIEFICRLHHLKKISEDASIAMINNLVDYKLYNSMMGRDVNFRYGDLSSVFSYPKPIKYFKRIFQEGDLMVPRKITNSKPILNLTTHDLLGMSKPIFKALKTRLTFVEVVRHPLFMLIQQFFNFERSYLIQEIFKFISNIKNQLPYFIHGWEELFLKSNNIDRTIYCMEKQINLTKKFKDKNQHKIITIPFEIFVKLPNKYLKFIEHSANTLETSITKKIMRKQKVPRKNIVDGLPLSIYKRCGWEAPISGLSERDEYMIRRKFAVDQGASKKALEILDNLSEIYNKIFIQRNLIAL